MPTSGEQEQSLTGPLSQGQEPGTPAAPGVHPGLNAVYETKPRLEVLPAGPGFMPDMFAEELIAANGNAKLAAERLQKRLGEPVTEARVLDIISTNNNTLAKIGRSLRAAAILRLFDMQRFVHDQLVQSIDDLEMSDLSRLYASLSHEVMTATSQAAKQEIDSNSDAHYEAFLRQLPPEVRKAVVALANAAIEEESEAADA